MFTLYTRQVDYFVSLLAIYFNEILKNLSVEKHLKNAIILSTRLIISRSDMMKKLKKIFLVTLIIIVMTVGLVFALRLYNEHKYGKDDLSLPDYYANVTDINLYPKTIKGVDV